MKNLLGLVLVASIFAVPGRASGADPLVEADQILKETAREAADSLRRTAQAKEPAPSQAPAGSAEYCVSQPATGPEGMPDFFNFFCTGGVRLKSMRRFCWTSSCRDSFASDMKAMLRSNGYELQKTFTQGRDDLTGYSVFRKPAADAAAYCLALRFKSYDAARSTSYTVDCADRAVTQLKVVEPDNGTTGIERYLGERGYALEGRFEANDRGFSPVLFRRR